MVLFIIIIIIILFSDLFEDNIFVVFLLESEW
jgi:hypothetical protein